LTEKVRRPFRPVLTRSLSRDSIAKTSGSIGVDFGFLAAQKNFEKSEKKACQLLTGSLNGWIDATKGPESRSKKL